MPRLRDLLVWLAGGAGDDGDGEVRERRLRVWVLLDLKDDAGALVAAVADALAQEPPGAVPCAQRILLGCWNVRAVASRVRPAPLRGRAPPRAPPRAHPCPGPGPG